LPRHFIGPIIMEDIILKSNNLRCAFYAPLKMVYLRRSGLWSFLRSLFIGEKSLLKFHFSRIKKFKLHLKGRPDKSIKFKGRLYMLTDNERVLIWRNSFQSKRQVDGLEKQLSKLVGSPVEITEKEVGKE